MTHRPGILLQCISFHSFIHQFNNTAYTSHPSKLDKEIKVVMAIQTEEALIWKHFTQNPELKYLGSKCKDAWSGVIPDVHARVHCCMKTTTILDASKLLLPCHLWANDQQRADFWLPWSSPKCINIIPPPHPHPPTHHHHHTPHTKSKNTLLTRTHCSGPYDRGSTVLFQQN